MITQEIKLFQEVTYTKKAIIKQIAQSIYEICLKRLRNRNTNTIRMNAAQILIYLFDRWRIVNDEELQAKENECWEIVYDLTEPILILFDKYEE